MKFASMITSTDQKTGDWGDNKDTDEEILNDINSTKPHIEQWISSNKWKLVTVCSDLIQ